ncbi:MAG: NAD(P)/FAD-dependent oxidoreductase [Treponemataceae bacterium]
MLNKYAMIVIGGGIAGLSTALAWTKVRSSENETVLVLERNSVVGGCVSSFARGGYKFDTVQIIPDISDLLEFFGIDMPLHRYDDYYARLFLADTQQRSVSVFRVPSSFDSFRNDLTARFPAERGRVEKFFRYCAAMHEELRYLKTEPTLKDIASIVLHCPRILAASNKTYHQFLRGFGFKDQSLIEILDLFSSFSGLSGDRCAALLTTSAMMTTLEGAYRPRGEFIRLPIALRDALTAAGGVIRTNASAAKIIVENGKAAGVALRGGETIKADIVVSTADTKAFAGELVGEAELKAAGKAYAKKIHEARMSPSAFAIHLGLDDGIDLKALGFECGYNVLTTGNGAFAKMFDAWERGELLRNDDCFHFGVYNSSITTGGKNNLVIHVMPAPTADWAALRASNPEAYRVKKERIADFYIGKLEEYLIPGLSEHIVFRDIATPATYARYIGSPSGSNFDMLPVPGNFGKNRLKTKTPVKNLFLPKFSHGIWPSMQAGLQVADMISDGRVMGGNARYGDRS